MRLLASVFFVAVPLIAQQAPAGLVHGSLLTCEIHQGSGELSIRTAGQQVFRFSFDAKTYFERDSELVPPGRLESGDWLEIVSDKLPGSCLRYARTVHVVNRTALLRARRLRQNSSSADRDALDALFPRGNLTFAGIVERLNGEYLILRTREGETQSIFLRQDTRYLAQGTPVDAAALRTNTRVYIRAGKNFDNQLEAYQVVWGTILKPRARP